MKPIRIFRHEDWVPPGRLTAYLDERSIPWELVCIDRGDEVSQRLDDVSGLAFLGGTMSVNDPMPWLGHEMQLIREAANRDVPLLGHCLGSQLIAKALGGTVAPMPSKEIGWFAAEKYDNPIAQEWLGDMPDAVEFLAWHKEDFTLPQGTTPLYATKHCPEHSFVRGNILATGGHPEVTVEILEEWLRVHSDDIAPIGPSIQPIDKIRERMQDRCAAMHNQLTDRLYDAWLERFPA